MNKKIMIITLVFSLLLFSGCPDNRPNPINIYTGTEGITINFPKNIPPDKVYESTNGVESTFVIVLDMWNKGAHSLGTVEDNSYGVIHVDYDPFYFSQTVLDGGDRFSDLNGKSVNFPKGERTIKEVSALKVNKITGTRESPKTTITASICYPYNTTLSQEICIDSDYLKEESNPVCENKEMYTYSGQGSPVSISKIETDMLPLGNNVVQPVFRITIKNVGKGLVLTKEPYKEISEICSLNIQDRDGKDINSIIINAWLDNEDNKLKCIPEKPRLYQEETEVTCTFENGVSNYNVQGTNYDSQPITMKGGYTSFLNIDLYYVYRSYVQKEITIQRVPT